LEPLSAQMHNSVSA